MPRGIDHLVLATRDLEACADLYRRLGFTVGARNRHPWGTLNHIVQLDGGFLELIATEPGFTRPSADAPVSAFAGFLDDYLTMREGLAMLVLGSGNAAADARHFGQAGFGPGAPFFFERKGKRPDGQDIHLAFTLAFAQPRSISDAGFFVCQQHFPEAFWNPTLQRHANGARRVVSVTLAAEDPPRLARFLDQFAGAAPVIVPDGVTVETGRGRIEVLTPEAMRRVWGASVSPHDPARPHLVGYRIGSGDMTATRAALERGQVGFDMNGSQLIVPSTLAHGAAIAFEPA